MDLQLLNYMLGIAWRHTFRLALCRSGSAKLFGNDLNKCCSFSPYTAKLASDSERETFLLDASLKRKNRWAGRCCQWMMTFASSTRCCSLRPPCSSHRQAASRQVCWWSGSAKQPVTCSSVLSTWLRNCIARAARPVQVRRRVARWNREWQHCANS